MKVIRWWNACVEEDSLYHREEQRDGEYEVGRSGGVGGTSEPSAGVGLALLYGVLRTVRRYCMYSMYFVQ